MEGPMQGDSMSINFLMEIISDIYTHTQVRTYQNIVFTS